MKQMKNRMLAIFGGCLLALSAVGQESRTTLQELRTKDDIRRTELFNFGWLFKAGDPAGAEHPAFDDSAWHQLDLPHDFQIEQPWDEQASRAHGFKTTGTAWYRKHFATDPAWAGKRIFLDFEGILTTGDVYLNGTLVGGTDYGYLGFETDITPLLNTDGENVVAVRASTEHTTLRGSRWYTGGGLYRDVYLFVKDTVAVARHGLFVTTPAVTDERAEVAIQVAVEGIRGKRTPVEIEAVIFGPDGRQVAAVTTATPLKSRLRVTEVTLPVISVEQPRRWSCENPELYTAVVTLRKEGRICDRTETQFGIRTVEFSPEYGLKLNGKKVLLKGISNHHDLGAVGAAAYERAIERQFETLKAFGFNHVRTSHNPYSESFLRLADKHGILIVDELFDKWDKDYWIGRRSWRELWPELVPEWIRRDRNHPSVILWSLGNELQIKEEWSGYPTGDWGVTTYRMMDVLVKRYDPTRKTTVAMFPALRGSLTKNDPDFHKPESVAPPELSVATDVASYNYRYMFFPRYRELHPHLIFYQSEAATQAMGSAFYGMDLDTVVGLAYWGAIEYWGESNAWPWKGWHFSFFDRTLQPYPQAWFVKSMFESDPVVRIGIQDDSDVIEWNDVQVGKANISSHWNRPAGSTPNVVVYTNAEEVELTLNGRSLGIRRNPVNQPDQRNTLHWDSIAYQPGRLTAIARTGGHEVARHMLRTTGKAVALKLVPESTTWRADGMDLQYVRVYAVDSRGQHVPTAQGNVTFHVAGAAYLLAVDNGNHVSDELFAGPQRQLHNGAALCILRSDRTAGTVRVEASADGLRTAKIELKTTR